MNLFTRDKFEMLEQNVSMGIDFKCALIICLQHAHLMI